MANNIKAKTNSLQSIVHATTQNETKSNVAITNEIPNLIRFLLEVAGDSTLKASQRMAAVKMLLDHKDKLDAKLLSQVDEIKNVASVEAKKALEEERVLVSVDSQSDIEAAKNKLRATMPEYFQ
ncbi:hypothetical protein ACWU4D_04415 [Vibrio sp. WJH972]